MSFIIHAISSYIPDFSRYWVQAQKKTSIETVIIPGKTVDIIVPERALTIGSLQIRQKSSEIDLKEIFSMSKKIIEVWSKLGITDFLNFRQISELSTYKVEMVPFSKNSWAFWQQLKVLWRVTLGGVYVSQSDKESIIKNFQENENYLSSQPRSRKTLSKKDAFCSQDITEKQLVFKGKSINILYDYAPIGLEKLHILFVPKKHREKFSDITEEEFLETSDLSQKLVNFYKNKAYSQQDFAVYIFDKTGTLAGQTVPHWHQHHVFTTTKIQGIWGKLTILKNMIFGSSPLKPEELNAKVKQLREDFKNLSKKTENLSQVA
ncbi:MAG: HIT family protein [Chlamydiales bacterium]|jgi:diadenosine tetraphosphate (Ap4A) HIT family hydrolase|nr:HIT family protein [Chlamydiales bacterium]